MSEKKVIELTNEEHALLVPLLTRAKVLQQSLAIEHYSSRFLAQLLNVEAEKSMSFGNTQSALSFDAKINLLIDLDALNKEEKKKFRLFMEIRNKFMHVMEVSSFVKCFELMKDRKKYFTSLYAPAEPLTEERHLSDCFTVLADSLQTSLIGIHSKVVSNLHKERDSGYNELLVNSIREFIAKTQELVLDTMPEEELKEARKSLNYENLYKFFESVKSFCDRHQKKE